VERAITPAPGSAERPLQFIVLGLLALLVYVLRPVVAALALGGLIVLVVYPLFAQLADKLHGRRTLATVIVTVAVVVGVVGPLITLGYLFVREAAAGIAWTAQKLDQIGGWPGLVRHLPRRVQPLVSELVRRSSSQLTDYAAQVATLTPKLLSSVGDSLAQLFLTVVTVYYLLKQGPAFVRFVRRVSPLRRSHTDAFLLEFEKVARGLFWGNLATAAAHGLAGGVGYAIVGAPRVVFLSCLTAIASFVPALGTSVIWVPIALGLLIAGDTWQGVVLLAWGFLVIGTIDNILRPLVSKGRMKLPDLLVFLTMFGGLMIFGVKGLLLGPLFGSLAVTGLRLVAREREGDGSPVTP
jgi:predicted PurR-regulated permease PerM